MSGYLNFSCPAASVDDGVVVCGGAVGVEVIWSDGVVWCADDKCSCDLE